LCWKADWYVFIGDEDECPYKDHVDSGDVVAFERFQIINP
jgi:hypothetical protein